ncbi:hypothetical protein [Actinomadura fibrosa]|uniref:DUF983 domain-containing protein n=1 Tax=Actinomadura fibrosa TaxID=111802 RepID=A0ABW2XNE4_9ACTN|nr:hypothetical protein [Actinomadura fibrosa]
MSRLPLGPRPGIGFGHQVSVTPGAFVTKREWLILPIPVERPEHGWTDQNVQCPVCGRTETVRVASLAKAQRRQQALRTGSAAALAVAALCALLLIPASAGLRLALGFVMVIAGVTAFTLFMRLGVEDGVAVRRPTATRMRGHMLRWPAGTPHRWQRPQAAPPNRPDLSPAPGEQPTPSSGQQSASDEQRTPSNE